MKPNFVDSHAHLDFPDFQPDLEEVLDRARSAGVFHVITVGTNLTASRSCLDLASNHADVDASVGIHPHDAPEALGHGLSQLESMAKDGAVAVGEIGLDYYRDRSPRDAQKQAFRAQLDLANRLELPVIVHSRQAWEDTAAILAEIPPARGGVIHCFSGDARAAAQAIDMGMHLSFAGPLTFPNAQPTREIAATVPLSRLMLETDAPFLSPHPFRGKRNEPARVVEVAKTQAMLHHASLIDTAWTTTNAVRSLFGAGPPIPRSLIAYSVKEGLYLNITNRCSLNCTFCDRLGRCRVGEHELKLPAEPTVTEIWDALSDRDINAFEEVVFCGYGEPTVRLDALVAVGKRLREQGVTVRLNTNGTANLIHKRDVTSELSAAVDRLSVSLNAQSPDLYDRLCRPATGGSTYEGVKAFLAAAAGQFESVTATAVDGVPGVDVEACRRIAENLGVQFRRRVYMELGE